VYVGDAERDIQAVGPRHDHRRRGLWLHRGDEDPRQWQPHGWSARPTSCCTGWVVTRRAPSAASHDGAAAPIGSLRQLAALFSGSPERGLLEAIYGLRVGVAAHRRQPGARGGARAPAVVAWELDRLAAGRPSIRWRRRCCRCAGGATSISPCCTRCWWQPTSTSRGSPTSPGRNSMRTCSARPGPRRPARGDARRRARLDGRRARVCATAGRGGAPDRDAVRAGSDLARGRLYAPLQVLEAAGIEPPTLTTGAAAVLYPTSGRLAWPRAQ